MLSFYHIEGLMSKAINVYGNNSVMDDTLDGNDAEEYMWDDIVVGNDNIQ